MGLCDWIRLVIQLLNEKISEVKNEIDIYGIRKGAQTEHL